MASSETLKAIKHLLVSWAMAQFCKALHVPLCVTMYYVTGNSIQGGMLLVYRPE